MAEELAKIDTEVKVTEPKAPASGRLSFSDIMGVREPFVKKKGELREQARMAEEQILTSQQAQKETAAEGKMAVEQRTTQQVRGAQEQLQERIKAEPLPAFVPTQDNFRDVAGLFSLIGVMGMIAGKSNGLAAMNAMNGMLEGYRSGRNDLYRREREVFDKNFKTMLQKHSEFRKEMEDAVKLAQTDRQAGLQAAELAAVKAGSPIIKAQIARGRLLDAYEEVKDFEGAAFKAVQMFDANLNAERAAAERAAQAARAEAARVAERAEARELQDLIVLQTEQGPMTVRKSQLPTATGELLEKATSFGRAAAGQPGGAIQFRYNAAMTNAGNSLATDILNAASLPVSSTLPVAAEVLTNPATGLVDAARAFFTQGMTPADSRAMQQVIAGMSRAITTIEASGRPSGATEASIREFNKTAPRAGDNRINMYLFLAQTKQIFDILIKDLKANGGTQEQIKYAEEAKDRVNQVITWDVTDIADILSKGGSRLVDDQVRKAIATSRNLQEFNRKIKTKQPNQEQQAPAPQAATPTTTTKQKALFGEEVFEDANGNRAVKRGNNWVEVE